MNYPTERTPTDNALAQYLRALATLRRLEVEALSWGWYDHWQDLCRLEERLERAAEEETKS